MTKRRGGYQPVDPLRQRTAWSAAPLIRAAHAAVASLVRSLIQPVHTRYIAVTLPVRSRELRQPSPAVTRLQLVPRAVGADDLGDAANANKPPERTERRDATRALRMPVYGSVTDMLSLPVTRHVLNGHNSYATAV